MTDTAKPEPKTTALAQIESSTRGLVLSNLEDMKTVAQIILQSKLAPESYKTSEQIFVGLQTGAEIGLKPMQSLNSIVVIKGKPTLWGDAALALVKCSGLNEYCHEYFEFKGKQVSEKAIQYDKIDKYPDSLIAVCETKRKGEPEPTIRYFSVADAKLAGLWKKVGPWMTHPKRMLKYKARAFNLRDSYPDVLYGMHLTEEFIDELPLPPPANDIPPRDERRLTTQQIEEAQNRKSVESKIIDTPCIEPPASEKEEPKKAEDVSTVLTYSEVQKQYTEAGGLHFAKFAAFVLCRDEDEVDSADKFTVEMLGQIKREIEENGVEAQ